MTDLAKLTADHGATVERLDAQERAHRKQRRTVVIALVTALGATGGTATKAFFDYLAKRDAIHAGAQAEATGAELDAVRWEEAGRALKAMDDELEERAKLIAGLETRIAKTEVAIEFLTADQRWIRRTASSRVERSAPPMPARKRIGLMDYGDLRADPERVQRRKAKILETNGIAD